MNRDRERAEDRLSWLQGLRQEAVNLRLSIAGGISCGMFGEDELKHEAGAVDDVVSDLSGMILKVQDEVYAAQIARKPRARFESAA